MNLSPSDRTSAECAHVLERVYEFLDHELDNASGDAIREHLQACEPCLDRFDVEQALKSLIARRCGGDTAPAQLRAKILSQLHTTQS
jgi:mycothiol system anti-sigma-R factor